jgi:hypothetical protein
VSSGINPPPAAFLACKTPRFTPVSWKILRRAGVSACDLDLGPFIQSIRLHWAPRQKSVPYQHQNEALLCLLGIWGFQPVPREVNACPQGLSVGRMVPCDASQPRRSEGNLAGINSGESQRPHDGKAGHEETAAKVAKVRKRAVFRCFAIYLRYLLRERFLFHVFNDLTSLWGLFRRRIACVSPTFCVPAKDVRNSGERRAKDARETGSSPASQMIPDSGAVVNLFFASQYTK